MNVKTLERMVAIFSDPYSLSNQSMQTQLLKIIASERSDIFEFALERLDETENKKVSPRLIECVSKLWEGDTRLGLQKVSFIKDIRMITGYGLKEAKDIAEYVLGMSPSAPMTGTSMAHELRSIFHTLEAKRKMT